MTERPALPRDYLDIIAEFVTAGVDFLVVGGWAVTAHGHPRYTKDFDLLVRPDPANAVRVYQALCSFGANVAEVIPADFAAPGLVFQVGVAAGARIDVLTSIGGLTFEEAAAERVGFEFTATRDGATSVVRVPVIGLQALLKNKRAVGRPHDLRDVKELLKAAGARSLPTKPSKKKPAARARTRPVAKKPKPIA